MKIYFAGSIRGGRQDAARYAQIIELLKGYGSVLTEHVGERDLEEEDLSDRAIYQRDRAWLREADVVIAEITVPSHGVGYEIGLAEMLGKPILCLHRPQAGHPVSAMVAGNPAVRCKGYREMDQLKTILEGFLHQPEEDGQQPAREREARS